MSAAHFISDQSNRRIFGLALVILALDQFTKWVVLHTIPLGFEKTIIPGFFNFAHRINTGAAWSMFTGNNALLAIVALVALVALFLTRRHFNADKISGQIAFGLIFGGIIGNLTDRLLPGRHAVIDFLHFYLQRRGSAEPLDFPAFNVADSAICTGVALIFIITWRNEHSPKPVEASK
ncbi:MAG TPA: signal peptidase II [Verrucomicrobiae bacterium]|jgi:signal peptidase II